jgi:hypothetical protein
MPDAPDSPTAYSKGREYSVELSTLDTIPGGLSTFVSQSDPLPQHRLDTRREIPSPVARERPSRKAPVLVDGEAAGGGFRSPRAHKRAPAPESNPAAVSFLSQNGGVVGFQERNLVEAQAAVAEAAMSTQGRASPVSRTNPWRPGSPAEEERGAFLMAPPNSHSFRASKVGIPYLTSLGARKRIGKAGELDAFASIAAFTHSVPAPVPRLVHPLAALPPQENLGVGLEPMGPSATLPWAPRQHQPTGPPDHVHGSVGAFIYDKAPVDGLDPRAPRGGARPGGHLDRCGGVAGHGAGLSERDLAGGVYSSATSHDGRVGGEDDGSVGGIAGSGAPLALRAKEENFSTSVGHPPPQHRATRIRKPLSGTAIKALLDDCAAVYAINDAADEKFQAARRAAAVEGGYSVRAPPRLLSHAAGYSAADAALTESARFNALARPWLAGPAAQMSVHGTSAAGRMAAVTSGGGGGGGGRSGGGGNNKGGLDSGAMEALRVGLRATLPANPSAATLLLRHRLRCVDGDGDGVVADDDLLRVVMETAQGLNLKGEGEHAWCTGAVLPESVGMVVRHLRGVEVGGAATVSPTGSTSSSSTGSITSDGTCITPNALHRVAGLPAESFVAWVMGGEVGGVPRVELPTPTSHVPEVVMPGDVGAVGGSEGSSSGSGVEESAAGGKKKKAGAHKITGRPVFEGDTPEARFSAFRSHWEGKHGEAGRKEMAMDREVAAPGPTWASAQPVEFKVLRLAGGVAGGGR